MRHAFWGSGSILLVTLGLLAGNWSEPVSAEPLAGDPDRGRQLYFQGRVGTEPPPPARLQGDITSTAAQFPCVSCHRPSGYGGSEGGVYVPPITGPLLFGPPERGRAQRNRLFREFFKEVQAGDYDAELRKPRMRPAYDSKTLARAIRHGKDSAGRDLNPTMPRYGLDDQAMADLEAFLRQLSASRSPGVTDEVIHLATVIGANADPQAAQAVLETQRHFIRWYNEDMQAQMDRPGFSPFYRSEFKDAYRRWKLHVWRLEGEPASWPGQLAAHYRQQPVFALVSGLVEGPFAPVDRFCNEERLPCLFPNTSLPHLAGPASGYTIYFSRGLQLEGEALALHLAGEAPQKRFHILALDQPSGRVPAYAFRDRLKQHLPEAAVGLSLASGREAMLEKLQELGVNQQIDVLVLWPGDATEAVLDSLAKRPPVQERITLPSAAIKAASQRLQGEPANRLRFTYPYEKPQGYHPRQYRIRAWMHSRGLELSHDRLQLQTYYALTQLQYTIAHLIDDFHRDYLIERIEHEAEAQLNPGTHPRLALGPGQRFASKGAYIMKLGEKPEAPWEPVSGWLTP